ncbi:MAG: hypothetical protein V5A55_06880 [Halovenus sp.]
MTATPSDQLLTPQTCASTLTDHQPEMVPGVDIIETGKLRNLCSHEFTRDENILSG